MKFNKCLARAKVLTTFIAPDMWLDYKGLKKILSDVRMHGVDSTQLSENKIKQLLACPATCAFFTQIMCELHKVSKYYVVIEAELLARYQASLDNLNEFLVKHWVGNAGGFVGAEWDPSTKAHLPEIIGIFLSFSSELIQLENYCVLCYAGFGKILKKHDKLSGGALHFRSFR